MKKMKRILSVSLAAAMLLSGCGGKNDVAEKGDYAMNETGYPIVNESISMVMMGSSNSGLCDWKDNLFFKEMEKKTNIHFEFNTPNNTVYAEKKNLAFASEELPDVFFKSDLTPAELSNYGGQGLLIPLEGYIETYAPNLKKLMDENEEIKKVITAPDGHIYSFPMVGNMPNINTMLYNKKWADKLGLSEPENVDEYYEMLKAFKEQDPNGNGKKDEVPLVVTGVDGLRNSVFHAFGIIVDANFVMIDDGGKAVFTPYKKGFREAVAYCKKLYDEGLLDKDVFTLNSQQINAMGTADEEILGSFVAGGAFVVVGEDRHFDYDSITPMEYNGKRIYNVDSLIKQGGFAITKNCKYPEAAVRWVDYLYSDEGGKLAWCGVEGVSYKMNDDGSWNWILADGESQGDVRGKCTIQPGSNFAHKQPGEFFYKIDNKYEASLKTFRGKVEPYARPAVPVMYYDDADLTVVNSIGTDLRTYISESVAKFIIGQYDLDKDWDGFIAKTKDMRAEKMISIYQKTYDRRENK